jgi:hypothetical protein
MKFIKPSLFTPGMSFLVNDFVKDCAVGIGSKGYLAIVHSIHETYQNVAKITAVITRRGKGGKPRLEKHDFAVPIFIYFENEENFRKLMPSIGDVRNYTSIEREQDEEVVADMIKAPVIDFLGWASSLALHLRHVSTKNRYGTWPEDQAHPLNRFHRMHELYNEDKERFEEQYGEKKARLSVIEAIRRTDSALVKMRMGHTWRTLDVILNAAEFMVYVNRGDFIPSEQEDKTNNYKFTEDQKLLEENFKYHKGACDNLQKMCSEKKIPIV